MTMVEPEFRPSFQPESRVILERSGWTIADLPPGLTLATLRQQGAPFRGERFFREFAPDIVETSFPGGQVAYQAGLLTGSVNQYYDDCEDLVAAFNQTIPPGCWGVIGSAAAYVQILWRRFQATGTLSLPRVYTWASDLYPDGHLVVGEFGQARPLVVAPHLKSGAGIGVMPLIRPVAPRASE